MFRYLYLILAFSVLAPMVQASASSHEGLCTRAEIRQGCQNTLRSECQMWGERCAGSDQFEHCVQECKVWGNVNYCDCGWGAEAANLVKGSSGDHTCSRREEFGMCLDGNVCCKKMPACLDGGLCQ